MVTKGNRQPKTQLWNIPVKYRYFDGRRFTAESVGNQEPYARSLATRLREQGHYARVVKVYKNWVVYKGPKRGENDDDI